MGNDDRRGSALVDFTEELDDLPDIGPVGQRGPAARRPVLEDHTRVIGHPQALVDEPLRQPRDAGARLRCFALQVRGSRRMVPVSGTALERTAKVAYLPPIPDESTFSRPRCVRCGHTTGSHHAEKGCTVRLGLMQLWRRCPCEAYVSPDASAEMTDPDPHLRTA